MSLKNKKILIIVGGGIAAYKSLDLIRLLKKNNNEVKSILTKSGREFVTGDANYTVGKTIRIRFLDTNPYLDDQTAKFDLKKSGDYLIMTAKHVFSDEGVTSELTCGRVASLGVEAEL